MKKRERRSNNQHAQIRKKLAARVEAMSCGERAKLDRLLINVGLLRDVQKAATKIGLSSKLHRKWLHTPEIRWIINRVLAKAHARTGDAGAIAGYCGKSAALDNALAKFAKLYADQTESDYEQFKKAIAKGRVRAVLGK